MTLHLLQSALVTQGSPPVVHVPELQVFPKAEHVASFAHVVEWSVQSVELAAVCPFFPVQSPDEATVKTVLSKWISLPVPTMVFGFPFWWNVMSTFTVSPGNPDAVPTSTAGAGPGVCASEGADTAIAATTAAAQTSDPRDLDPEAILVLMTSPPLRRSAPRQQSQRACWSSSQAQNTGYL
jgi:hypothetical protein